MDGSGAARLNKRAKSYSLVAVVVLITAGLVSAAPARPRQQSSGDLNVVQVRPNVVAILYDAEDNAMSASRTYINSLNPLQFAPLSSAQDEPLNTNANRIHKRQILSHKT